MICEMSFETRSFGSLLRTSQWQDISVSLCLCGEYQSSGVAFLPARPLSVLS